MSRNKLEQIESQLDELINRYHQLKRDYYALNKQQEQQQQHWEQERARLQEKNELACARIEAMLQRLKNIETEANQ